MQQQQPIVSSFLQGAGTTVCGTEFANKQGDDVAAVTAGRANAAFSMGNDQKDLCLERLLAASGFGRYHIVQVVGKLHQLLGCNITVVKPVDPSPNVVLKNTQDESSHGYSSNSSQDNNNQELLSVQHQASVTGGTQNHQRQLDHVLLSKRR